MTKMAVRLAEITVDNYKRVIELCVAPEQEQWVGTPAEAIAQVHFHAHLQMRAIVLGDGAIVGMIVYETSDAPGGIFLWLHRVMVDCHHQRRGYGRAALLEMLRITGTKPENVYVRTKPDNSAAIKLYLSLGFPVIAVYDD